MIATTFNQAETTTKYPVELGRAYPLGAKPDQYGVNFSIFSEHATSVELLLFETPHDPEPIQIIQLDSKLNKTFFLLAW